MKQFQVRQQIATALNFQYRTDLFKSNHSFHDLLNICANQIHNWILYAKYDIDPVSAAKYGIKNDTDTSQCPFEKHQQHFLHQLATACQLVILEPEYRNLNTLNQYIIQNKMGALTLKPEYREIGIYFRFISIKQAMVYIALSQCKIWYIVCRNRKKSNKQFELDPLIDFFKALVDKLKLQNPYHVAILTKKAVRSIEKKEHIEKATNPLFDAVSNSEYGLVKQLLLKGAKLEKPSFYHRSHQVEMRCTHRACMNNDLQMCKILHSFGADWQAEDSQKMTPLFYAVQAGSLEVIKYLIEQIKVNKQKQQIQNRTPFYFACTQNSPDVIDYLYNSGCNINSKSSLGRTALSKACYLGRVDIVNYLLGCKQIDMYSMCKKGRNALHNAVFGPKGGREGHKFGTSEKDSPQCAQILLQKGFEVDKVDFQDCTALHVAMSSEAIDSIRILLAFGASLERRNNYGETPLLTGAKFGHEEAVRILMDEYNSDIFVKDIFNKNLLLLTAKFKNGEEGINPVFDLLLSPFIEGCKKQGNLQELHYTFRQLLINQSPVELEKLWNQCQRHEIILQEFSVQEIQKLLNLSINRRGIIESNLKYLYKNHQKQAFKKQAAKQINIAAQILKSIKIREEILLELCEWIIKNNDGKLLDFILEAELLCFDSVDLDPSLIWTMIENDALGLKERVISYCLISLNFNWLEYRSQHKQNIFHILVRKQRGGSLVQVFKSLSNKIPQRILRNKYIRCLKTQDECKKVLYDLLQEKNQSGLTPHQLSLILKNKSIAKIIEQKLREQKIEIDNMLDIHQYEAIIEEEPAQLAIFTEKVHEKQESLQQFEYQIQEMSIEEIQTKWKLPYLHLKQKINENFWQEVGNRELHYINRPQQLQILTQLLDENVIGIDLEYFPQDKITIISTLQLSSVSADYIIDCLAIQLKPIRTLLQPIFHHTSILKIMHGADTDLILLRSSFNLSLINFVDTSRIDLQIRDSKKDLRGLSTLCQQYLGLVMSKQYQVSEWRIRPLPKAMLDYARKDSLILSYLFSDMLTKIQDLEMLRQIVLSGCRQVRRNKKVSQPLIKAIRTK